MQDCGAEDTAPYLYIPQPHARSAGQQVKALSQNSLQEGHSQASKSFRRNASPNLEDESQTVSSPAVGLLLSATKGDMRLDCLVLRALGLLKAPLTGLQAARNLTIKLEGHAAYLFSVLLGLQPLTDEHNIIL